MRELTLPAHGISGHITLRRWQAGAEGKAEVRVFDNLITDRILASRLGDFVPTVSIREAMAYCRVGTGNAAPLPSNIALAAQVAATNTITAGPTTTSQYTDTGRGYVSLAITYQFAAGAAAGVLQEVGFGSTAAADVLMSRALILDAPGGTPTPLIVGLTDFLQVVYEVRLYTPADSSDVVQSSVQVDGEDYDITLRPIGAPASLVFTTAGAGPNWTSFDTKEIRHLDILGLGNNWLGAFEADEIMPAVEDPWNLGTMSTVIDANTILAAYVPSSKERSIDVTIPSGELNLTGGIQYFRLSTSEGSWGLGFDVPMAKEAGKVLTFTVLVQALQRFTP